MVVLSLLGFIAAIGAILGVFYVIGLVVFIIESLVPCWVIVSGGMIFGIGLLLWACGGVELWRTITK